MLWLKNLFTEMGFSVPLGLPMCIDNQSAMQVAKNPEHHGRMKHLDLAFYWLRDVVDSKIISPIHIPTEENAADLLTKALSNVKFSYLRSKFGLKDLSD